MCTTFSVYGNWSNVQGRKTLDWAHFSVNVLILCRSRSLLVSCSSDLILWSSSSASINSCAHLGPQVKQTMITRHTHIYLRSDKPTQPYLSWSAICVCNASTCSFSVTWSSSSMAFSLFEHVLVDDFFFVLLPVGWKSKILRHIPNTIEHCICCIYCCLYRF